MPRHLMNFFFVFFTEILLIDQDQGVRETQVHGITMG
jgi:hypothetical protein